MFVISVNTSFPDVCVCVCARWTYWRYGRWSGRPALQCFHPGQKQPGGRRRKCSSSLSGCLLPGSSPSGLYNAQPYLWWWETWMQRLMCRKKDAAINRELGHKVQGQWPEAQCQHNVVNSSASNMDGGMSQRQSSRWRRQQTLHTQCILFIHFFIEDNYLLTSLIQFPGWAILPALGSLGLACFHSNCCHSEKHH